MIFGLEVGFQADYWALGCILYKLLTGFSPFIDKDECTMFQNMKHLKIKWSESISKEAKDLIANLLKHEPEDRIGSNNIYDLINHKYFINEVYENLVLSMKLNNIPFKNSLQSKEMIEEKLRLKSQIEFVDNKVILLKAQLVEKKSPFLHYNTRILRLYNTPKLEYSDPETKEVKGIIYLDTFSKAIFIDSGKFELTTPQRSFVFKVENNESENWCNLINNEVQKLFDYDPEMREERQSIILNEKLEFKKGNKKEKIY